jgi:ABC-type transport system involved in multi-copper enzyme maturation permease subunit
MTRLQKKILALVGFSALIVLLFAIITVIPWALLAFFYHNSGDLKLAILDFILLPVLVIIVSFTLGQLKRG